MSSSVTSVTSVGDAWLGIGCISVGLSCFLCDDKFCRFSSGLVYVIAGIYLMKTSTN